jgi:hypothetical protein
MKIFVFTIMLATLTAGFASRASAYDACAGNYSQACTDDRNAYAEHHGGQYPGQAYDNSRGRYNNRRGNWTGTARADRRHRDHPYDRDRH